MIAGVCFIVDLVSWIIHRWQNAIHDSSGYIAGAYGDERVPEIRREAFNLN